MSQIEDAIKLKAKVKFMKELETWHKQCLHCLGIPDEAMRKTVDRQLAGITKKVFTARIEKIESDAIESFITHQIGR